MGFIFPQALLSLYPRVEDSRESLFFHGAVAVTYVCNCRHAWFSRRRLQLYLWRSNFYPADFLPEPPNLSFKELGELCYKLIVGGESPMYVISTQAYCYGWSILS